MLLATGAAGTIGRPRPRRRRASRAGSASSKTIGHAIAIAY